MNPEAVAWLNQFAQIPLNDRQRLTLVYLRHRQSMTNSDYRRLNRVGTIVAGQELRGLVQMGLVEQKGVGRWTSYRLKVGKEFPEHVAPQTDDQKILAHVRKEGSINNTECREVLEVDEVRAYYLLKKLCDRERLKPEGKGKGRRYVLP